MESTYLMNLYDQAADDYERTRVPRFRPFVKRLLQLYDTRPGSHVLDAGCGTGLAATMVAPRVGHSGKILGVDSSARMLEIARQKAQGYGFDQCEFVQGDLLNLDLADGAFDLVICSFALWGEPSGLFGEFCRVLKPGGVLLLQNWEYSRDGVRRTFNQTIEAFKTTHPSLQLQTLRAAQEQHGVQWREFDDPAVYQTALARSGFSSAHAQAIALPVRFANLDELLDFLPRSAPVRGEMAELDSLGRSQFDAALRDALRPLDSPTGITLNWTAIQAVARK